MCCALSIFEQQNEHPVEINIFSGTVWNIRCNPLPEHCHLYPYIQQLAN